MNRSYCRACVVVAITTIGACSQDNRGGTGSSPNDSSAIGQSSTSGNASRADSVLLPDSLHLTGAHAPSPAELARQAKEQRAINQREGVPAAPPGQTPTKFDWSDSADVTLPARHQRNQDCWAHATTAVVESNYLARTRPQPLDFSEQAVIDCSGSGTAASGGWWAYGYVKSKGIPTESNYPYVGLDRDCLTVPLPRYFDLHWGYVADDGAYATTDAIKQAIVAHGPVGAAIAATYRLRAHKHTDQVFTEWPDYHGRINHVVTLIGWDDAKQAWHVKNSWGVDWGRDGLGWVRYGENAIGFGATWAEMKPAPNRGQGGAAR